MTSGTVGGGTTGSGTVGSGTARGTEAAGSAPRATPARIYDYYLGGVHNFSADREAAEAVAAQFPIARPSAQANRAFLRRAVRHIVDSGVRQLLDVGSGIPTVGNVHEIAQSIAPDSRVVYVDVDTVAVAESLEILDGNGRATAICADMNEPDAILNHPRVRDMLDFNRPIGLIMASVLHFVPDDAKAYAIVAQLLGPLAPGSYLAVSQAAAESYLPDTDQSRNVADIYRRRAATAGVARTRSQVERLLTGTEPIEPGVVWVTEWRPDDEVPPEFAGHPERCGMWAGVGRKR